MRSEFALDLFDIIEIVRRDRPGSMNRAGDLLAVWRNDFASIRYRGGEQPSKDAIHRAWERWKSKVRAIGVVDDDAVVDWDEGFERDETPLVIRVSKALEWCEKSIGLAATLTEARDQIAKSLEQFRQKGRKRKPSGVRIDSAKSAMEAIGVQYTPTRLRTWRDRGAPFDIVKKGSRELYYTSVQELDRWIESAVADGLIKDPFQRRILIEEARPKIIAAITRSGLTKSEFAKRIGITWAMLESYVIPSSKVKRVPANVVDESERVGLEAPGSDLHSKYARAGTPPLSAIKKEIERAGGSLSAASRALKERGFSSGVTPENIRYIAKKHGIPYVTRSIELPTAEELRETLVRLDFNLTRTAKEFGISETSLSRVIDRCGMRPLVDLHVGAATREDLLEAMEVAGHDAAAAGALVGVGEDRFRSLLSQHGLNEDFANLAARERDAKFHAEHDRLKVEIEKAVAAGETRNEFATRIGMKRTSVESAVRRLLLRDLYNKLPYEVGAKARGSTREIGGERVPFWHAALTDLMRRFPEGGGVGLAKRLGMAHGVSVLPWVKGKRVPRYDMIEKIMAMAGREMPDWRGAIERAAPDADSLREVADQIGVARHGLYSMLKGHVNPSEKMLERILGDAFWVEAP